MMTEQCKGCRFNQSWCNRLVVNGGFGNNDRVASDFITKDNPICEYKEEGYVKPTPRPNFNSWAS